MSELGRYPHEVRGIADELKELLTGAIEDAAISIVQSKGEEWLLRMSDDEKRKALVFLKNTPAQRAKTLSLLNNEDAAVLIMRARYFGLMSERVLLFSQRFNNVVGMRYRDAAYKGALEALRFSPEPKLTDVLPALISSYPSSEVEMPYFVIQG